MFMDFLIPAKQRYYSKDNSEKILKKLSEAINEVTLSSRHELLCLFDGILSTTPCCYWNKNIYSQVISKLEPLPQQNSGMIIDEMAMEHFLIGYGTYKQVIDIINDLSGLNDSAEIKNRQYRIPTYISIVEGCLTNLFRFIALLLNQTTTKDYSSAYKLSPLCDILNSNDLSCATQHVDIDIRNAINHGGVIFKEDGRTIDFHYMKNHNSVSRTLQVYEFDRLIEQVYDTASAILLSLSVFLNNHWDLVSIDLSQKSFMSFALFSLELSIPHCKCRYIFDIPNNKQLNADFYITNTDRTFILQTAVELAIIIFTRYGDYDQYYFSFSGERLQTSWVRFTNQEVADMTTRKREITDVIQNALKRKDIIIFDPSTEEVNLQEIKYFRFPNYESDDFKITNIEDGSLPDRKRLRCQLYIGDITDKGRILEIIPERISYAFFPCKSCIFLCYISIYTIFTPRPEEKYASTTPYQQSAYYDHSMPSSLYHCALHTIGLFHRVHHSFYIWSQTYAGNNAVKMALVQMAPAFQNRQALLPAGLLLKQRILSFCSHLHTGPALPAVL